VVKQKRIDALLRRTSTLNTRAAPLAEPVRALVLAFAAPQALELGLAAFLTWEMRPGPQGGSVMEARRGALGSDRHPVLLPSQLWCCPAHFLCSLFLCAARKRTTFCEHLRHSIRGTFRATETLGFEVGGARVLWMTAASLDSPSWRAERREEKSQRF
jgi:hypothetical protein